MVTTRAKGLFSAAMAFLLLISSANSTVAQEDEERRITVAQGAFENNLTPFTLVLAGLPVTHDLMMLVYDTLFWSPVREDPEPWLAESAEPKPIAPSGR